MLADSGNAIPSNRFNNINIAALRNNYSFKGMSMTEEKKLEGLGGWLILVGLGIVVSPLRMIAEYYPMYRDLFANGDFELLTTPGTEYYIPGMVPLLYSELLINCLLVVAWVCIAFLFFTKRKLFPKTYIGILAFTVSFILVDTVAVGLVIPDIEMFDPDTVKELGKAAVTAAIWIPYTMVSERVKATFVR